MEFRVLGPLEVREADRLVSLGGAKQRALLAALLLHANEVVSRARLIDGLWGEAPPVTAAHTIETYVSRLRRLLHDTESHAVLVTRPPGYMLRIRPGQLDLNRFESLVHEGRTLADRNPEAAAELLRQALALYRGPPLDDVAFFPFAQAEMRRLAEMRLAALEDRIDADLAAGKSGDLVGELEGLVKAYPVRERLHAQLMLALYRSGRQAEGLDAYHRARRYLADELGVQPGTALRKLEQAILVQDPLLEAEPPKPPWRPTARESPARRWAIRGRALARAPWWLAGVLAVVLLASLAIGLSAAGRGRPGSLGAVPGDAMGIIDPDTGSIVGAVPLGGSAGQAAAGAGSVWVANFDDHTVSQIERRAVRQVIPVGRGPGGIAVGNGAVWVADHLDGTVSRIDPRIGQVVQTIPVGHGPCGVAYGNGAVWVAVADDRSVVGIDPRTGAVTRRVALEASPSGLAVGGGSVWATSQSTSEVFRISPDGKDVTAIRVGTGPSAIAVGPGAVWVVNSLDGTISRIDPSQDVVTATLAVGENPSGIAVSSGAVWVTGEFSGTVTRIKPRVPVVAQTIHVGDRLASIVVARGAVWVVAHARSAHRGGTLRVAAAMARLGSIDPGMASILFPPQMLGMINDGLVTLNHAAGTEGNQLVPDLARSLPFPGNGGRSYRFQLRPGIRYSTGKLVRPGDFRRAIERDFRIGSPGAALFADIVGASRCTGARPCHLSRGIAVNDPAGTVTFHLSRPDPDFLDKLTLPFAFAVPPGTPDDHDVGREPVPATGPYLIDRYEPGRELVLTRNPQFREWSQAAQPDGYPDQIVWRFGMSPDAAVTAVERGSADWDMYAAAFPGDRLAQIRTQHAPQVHVNPLLRAGFPELYPPDAGPRAPRKAVDFLSKRVRGYQFNPRWGILLDQLWVVR
jgi:YVTN family beta-propeller protein